jgi:serine/threonine protein kinase
VLRGVGVRDDSCGDRDLKSANLLLDDMHKLKLADFGLSRVLDNRKPDRTNKVITLWYRPPELLLGETRYGPAVDMWSIGCIIIELFRKRPLFAADTDAEMLERIFHVLGSPTASTWSGFHKLASKSGFSLAKSYDPTLDRVFASAGVPYHAQRLLKSLLSLDPELRPSASEALKSPFFTDVQHLSAELIAQRLGPISLHIDVTLDHHEFMARQRRRTRDSGPKLQPAKAEPAVVMPAPAPVPPPVVPEPTAPLLIPSGRVSSSGRVEYLLPPPVARPQSLFVIPEPVVKPFTLAPVAKLHKVDPHVEVAVAAKTDVKESPVVDRRRSRSRERSEKREHRRFSRSRSRDRRREDRPREHDGRHRERDREDRRDRHENRHREHRGREDRDDRERGRERERERDRRHHSYSDDRHRHRERGDRYRSRSPRR